MRIISRDQWRSTLQRAGEFSEIFLGQACDKAQIRDSSVAEKFVLREFRYGSPQLLLRNQLETFSLKSLEDKDSVIEKSIRVLEKLKRADVLRDRIEVVSEELLLNALVSAPRVYDELGLERELQLNRENCVFVVEWNDSELWLHAQDPYGVFFRKSFARSFRDMDSEEIKTHGFSGRGLDIILDLATDLFIRSKLEWGTWVAARIDLMVSNAQHDTQPKRLILDCT